MSTRGAPDDTLLWPVDRTFLLGFAPAGVGALTTLLAALLLHQAGPDARAWLGDLALLGQAVVWLLFAPIYLFGWVHGHPRRDVAATGWTGSVGLTMVMYLLNILAYGLLTLHFGPHAAVRWALC